MTQTELDSLLAAVLDEAKRAGVPVSDHICPSVTVNRRAKSRFGCCRRTTDGFLIEIASFLLEADEKAIRQTLAHEILHTCPGCSNHGHAWRLWAALMNRLYGYQIRRADSPEHLGITVDRPIKFLVICKKCGLTIPRMKRSPLVQHPERYRCRCGGSFFVEDAETEILF